MTGEPAGLAPSVAGAAMRGTMTIASLGPSSASSPWGARSSSRAARGAAAPSRPATRISGRTTLEV